MRVAEIAELTGTTVRTVRYYHSLGLLPVPAERGGWRDYDLSHVARLSRIRYLVGAGVRLEAVARILEPDGAAAQPAQSAPTRASDGSRAADDVDGAPGGGARASRDAAVETDLAAALASAEEHLTEATRRRDMLRTLLDRAHEGSTVSPMPPVMAAFFDRMEAGAPDERTRTAVRRERDVVDLACYRDLMPPEAVHLFPDAAEVEEDAESLASYGRDSADATDEQIDVQARWITGRLERRLPPERLRELAHGVDMDVVASLYRLVGQVDPHYERIAPAVAARFTELVERWREE
ncbi:MerR family transcriptional regulator [Actinomyces radicidentis]|uniref:MerR family transcriptional regulator n=1 Tax=Actinomyces radicidentis TaxID=111015 RepID=A0A0X8JDX7_ACTRD|nr:helix-turn-helix domain-containing protein [Actinomyces radicidentis]AMD86849.1 MerR family transcriptional regulator [Actinomyces radicidentis]